MGKLALGLTSVAVTAALAASLTACDSDAATGPPPTSSAVTATSGPSPSAGVSPAPPLMPEAAKAHTAAGAKAFVAYYWRVVDLAEATLDVAPVKSLSLPTCSGCNGGIDAVLAVRRAGGRYSGGGNTVNVTGIGSVRPGTPVVVAVTVANQPQREVIPGKKTVTHPAGKTDLIMTLAPTPSGWRVGELRSA